MFHEPSKEAVHPESLTHYCEASNNLEDENTYRDVFGRWRSCELSQIRWGLGALWRIQGVHRFLPGACWGPCTKSFWRWNTKRERQEDEKREKKDNTGWQAAGFREALRVIQDSWARGGPQMGEWNCGPIPHTTFWLIFVFVWYFICSWIALHLSDMGALRIISAASSSVLVPETWLSNVPYFRHMNQYYIHKKSKIVSFW